MFQRISSVGALAAAAVLIAGCSARPFQVKVDALSRPVSANSQSYRLKSKNPALGEENLRYKEAADYVRTALSGKGLYEAPNSEAADMVVEIDYGMEALRSKIERVSVPVYAQVGGGVRYDTVPVTDSRGNTTFRTVAVYDPPRSELVGYDDVPRQVTIYEKYLKITARENKPAAEGKPPAELWSVTATAEDESKDLRKYLPVMASATIEYIGRDSSHQTVVRVKPDDQGIGFVRRRMSETTPPEQPKG
jgi:outer membrane murein-binding lipoprotein Lpp